MHVPPEAWAAALTAAAMGVQSYFAYRRILEVETARFFRLLFGSITAKLFLFVFVLFSTYRLNGWSTARFVLFFMPFYLFLMILEIRFVLTKMKHHRRVD